MTKLLCNSMTCRYLSTQLTTLGRLGYPIESALNILDITLSQLKCSQKRISIQSVDAVYADAAEVLNDPLIALRVGYEFRVLNFAQTGTLYGYCQDLAQVMEMNRKYQKLAVDAAKISHDIEDGRHFFTLTPYENAYVASHVLLMILGAYASSFQWLTWTTGKEIKNAYFTMPTAENLSLFNDIFRCPVHFNQEKLRLEFHADIINTPLSTANPEKLALAISKLEALLKSQDESESFTQAARSAIRAALDMGAVSLSIVAKRMNMSERQLRQKLKSAEQNYRDLLEKERKSAFLRLYESGESFAIIAQSLGYNDQSAFNRAFKRWYGLSPTAYAKRTDVMDSDS